MQTYVNIWTALRWKSNQYVCNIAIRPINYIPHTAFTVVHLISFFIWTGQFCLRGAEWNVCAVGLLYLADDCQLTTPPTVVDFERPIIDPCINTMVLIQGSVVQSSNVATCVVLGTRPHKSERSITHCRCTASLG